MSSIAHDKYALRREIGELMYAGLHLPAHRNGRAGDDHGRRAGRLPSTRLRNGGGRIMLSITLGGVIIGVVLGITILTVAAIGLVRWFRKGYDIKLYGGQQSDDDE